MWVLQWLGIGEIVLILVATFALSLSRTGRRWRLGVLPCLLIGALAPPTDPLSMILLSIPLVGAFIAGVYLGPRVRSVQVA